MQTKYPIFVYQRDGQWYAEERKRIDFKTAEVTVVPCEPWQAIIPIILRTKFGAEFKAAPAKGLYEKTLEL